MRLELEELEFFFFFYLFRMVSWSAFGGWWVKQKLLQS